MRHMTIIVCIKQTKIEMTRNTRQTQGIQCNLNDDLGLRKVNGLITHT